MGGGGGGGDQSNHCYSSGVVYYQYVLQYFIQVASRVALLRVVVAQTDSTACGSSVSAASSIHPPN